MLNVAFRTEVRLSFSCEVDAASATLFLWLYNVDLGTGIGSGLLYNRSLLLRLVREWYVKVPFTRSILNYIILEWGCLALYGLWQEFSGLGKRFACFHGCQCGQGLFQYLLLHSLLALIPPMYMETIDENYILECSFLKY